MVRINLTEENLISTAGIADRRFADHSGDIQHGYQLGSLTEGLVAYYPMEEGQGKVLFDGATGNHGQIEGATRNGSGRVGSDSLSFNGSSDHVGLPFSLGDGVSPFAISTWVKTTETGSSKDAVAFASDGENFVEGFEDNNESISEDGWVGWNLNGGEDSNTKFNVTSNGFFTGTHEGELFINARGTEGVNATKIEPTKDFVEYDFRFDNDTGTSTDGKRLVFTLTGDGDTPNEAYGDVAAFIGEVTFHDANNSVTWGDRRHSEANGSQVLSGWNVNQNYNIRMEWDFPDQQVEIFIDGNSRGIFAFQETAHAWDTIGFINDTNDSNNTVRTHFDNVKTNPGNGQVSIGKSASDMAVLNLQGNTLAGGDTTLDPQSTTINDGNWHHLVGQFDGSDAVLYVDGTEVASQTEAIDGTLLNVRTTTGAVGANDENSSIANNWSGELDDVRVYDRRLSQPEIEALAGLTEPSGFLVEEEDVPSIDDAGALARYEFEGDVTDSWGDNDGTDNTSAGFVDGVFGQAKDFEEDNNDYVAIGDVYQIDHQPYTLSGWMNTESQATRNSMISAGDSGTQFLNLRMRTNGTIRLQHFTDSGGTNPTSGKSYSNGEWVHVAATWDTKNVKLYTNGFIADAIDETGQNLVPTNWDIGYRPGNGQYMDGLLEDVRIYSRALDPIEVETLFNKGAYRIKRGNL